MKAEMETAADIGKWTLIVGEVNTGKTTLSAKILESLCAHGLASRIAVVDLAPEIPEDLATGKKVKGAGGKLIPPSMTEVIYLSARLVPPRLSSASEEEEALAKAAENARKIDRLFRDFNGFDRDILFVNDVSVYLHAARAEKLIGQMSKASTLVANGYYGRKLGGGAISEAERREMDVLIETVESRGRVIWKK